MEQTGLPSVGPLIFETLQRLTLLMLFAESSLGQRVAPGTLNVKTRRTHGFTSGCELVQQRWRRFSCSGSSRCLHYRIIERICVVGQFHMVRTTRNWALPLIMRA